MSALSLDHPLQGPKMCQLHGRSSGKRLIRKDDRRDVRRTTHSLSTLGERRISSLRLLPLEGHQGASAALPGLELLRAFLIHSRHADPQCVAVEFVNTEHPLAPRLSSVRDHI